MDEDRYDFIVPQLLMDDRDRLIRAFEAFRTDNCLSFEQAKDYWSRMNGGRLMYYFATS